MLAQLLLSMYYSLANNISWSMFLNQFNLQERYLVILDSDNDMKKNYFTRNIDASDQRIQ